MRLEMINAGRVVGTHGVRGELRVQPRDGGPAFLTRFHTFFLDGRAMDGASCRAHGNLALVTLPGVDTLDAAQALRGKDLYIRREDARLPEGAYFDDELLGLDVFDAGTGKCLGELTAVDPYPAHKVYTVRGEREYLIPAVPGAFIRSVDLDANRMDVHVWEEWDEH